MKKHLILLILITNNLFLFAQFGSPQIIPSTIDETSIVLPGDIDNDGDIDFIYSAGHYSAGYFTGEIGWFENMDGLGTFSSAHVIETNIDGNASLFAADLDGDNDLDILSDSAFENEIVWYENLDGLGNFGPPNIISNNPILPKSVHASDIDNDGDLDVISASFGGNELAWYENINGQGTFGESQIISTDLIGANSVSTGDLDSDGDMDVLAAGFFSGEIIWCENIDGQGSFGPVQILYQHPNYAKFAYPADFDNDGDTDILFGQGNSVYWLKNIDGLGDFVLEEFATDQVYGLLYAMSADIDNDGDMDVISTASSDEKIVWHENMDGNGNFSSPRVVDTNASGVSMAYAVDLNGDENLDIIAAFSSISIDDKIVWYENGGSLSVSDNIFSETLIYPIPLKNILNVNHKTTIDKIEVYNILGHLIIAKSNQNQINVSSLKKGFYLVKVIDSNGQFIIKKVTKG